MGRRRLGGELVVAMNGIEVGRWSVGAGGRSQFRYVAEWLAQPAALPISLSMPLSPEPFAGDVVRNYFDNLLPDNADIRRRLQARLGARSTDSFDLLTDIGGDCVGAIQIHPPTATPPDVRRITAEPIPDTAIADTLRNYRERPLGIARDGDFRISIAGAQEKTALLRRDGRWFRPRGATPTSHILKLPIGAGGGIDLGDSVENEWLCLRIASAFGLPVARAEIETFAEQKVLVVERFDRRWAADGTWLMRVPQEDFCQALGMAPALKYESDGGPGIAASFALLRRSREAEADRRTFFRALVVFWLLAAIDGHAKNFSLFLLPGGRCRMTPIYDVLSAYPIVAKGELARQKLKMAMAVVGTNRHYTWTSIRPRHWLTTAAHVDLPESDAREVLHDILARGAQALADVRAQLPDAFPDAVATPILAGVASALERLGAGLS